VFEQIRDRLAEAGVRLHFPFLELDLAPGVQLFHHRPAMLLMEVETICDRHTQRSRLLIVAVDLA